MAKASKAEMLQREQDIRDHLSRAIPVADMCRNLAQKWKVSESAIRKQYENVVNDMRIKDSAKREDLRSTLLLRYEHLYREALADGRHKVAAEILNLVSKLSGLYEPEKEKKVEQPKFLRAKEGDFSKPLSLVDDKKAENE